jgi:hypothetical protein
LHCWDFGQERGHGLQEFLVLGEEKTALGGFGLGDERVEARELRLDLEGVGNPPTGDEERLMGVVQDDADSDEEQHGDEHSGNDQ